VGDRRDDVTRDRPLAELRNLGPVTARDLREVGIADAETLRETGAVAAYRRLKRLRPHHYTLVGLWALAGALIDCPWNRLPPDIKARLRAELSENPPDAPRVKRRGAPAASR
jgi:hypothetical protein